MPTDLSSYDNSWYDPGPMAKRICWYWTNLIFFRSGLFPIYGLKVFLLRIFGAKCGKNVLIKPFVNIKYPWFIVMGDHVWIGENVWLDNLGMITIGSNVCISQGAILISGNHDYSKASFDLEIRPIVLEEGTWIGAKAIISGGTMSRSHAVVTAGSVASGELDPYSVYKGNPAVKIKNRVI